MDVGDRTDVDEEPDVKRSRISKGPCEDCWLYFINSGNSPRYSTVLTLPNNIATEQRTICSRCILNGGHRPVISTKRRYYVVASNRLYTVAAAAMRTLKCIYARIRCYADLTTLLDQTIASNLYHWTMVALDAPEVASLLSAETEINTELSRFGAPKSVWRREWLQSQLKKPHAELFVVVRAHMSHGQEHELLLTANEAYVKRRSTQFVEDALRDRLFHDDGKSPLADRPESDPFKIECRVIQAFYNYDIMADGSRTVLLPIILQYISWNCYFVRAPTELIIPTKQTVYDWDVCDVHPISKLENLGLKLRRTFGLETAPFPVTTRAVARKRKRES